MPKAAAANDTSQGRRKSKSKKKGRARANSPTSALSPPTSRSPPPPSNRRGANTATADARHDDGEEEPDSPHHVSRLNSSAGRAPMRIETLSETLSASPGTLHDERNIRTLSETLRHDDTIRCNTRNCYAMEAFIKSNGFCIECNFVRSSMGPSYNSLTIDKYLYKPRTEDEYMAALSRGGQKSETTRARHKVYDATKKMSAARWAQIKAAIISAASERHTRSADGNFSAAAVMMGTSWGERERVVQGAAPKPILKRPSPPKPASSTTSAGGYG